MFPKRIPTILGLLLVVLLVGGIAVSFESVARLPIRASATAQPTNVQITNLSDIQFTMIWTTSSPATGAVIITSPQGNQTIFDERDQTAGKLNKYITHSVSVRNLKGSTEYKAKILSNGQQFLDNGNPYQIHTSPPLAATPGGLGPAYGSIVTGDNQPAEGALVTLTLEGSQTVSTVVKPSGAWLIPLNLVRTEDGMEYISVTDRLTEHIMVRTDGQTTQAITDTLNDSPVPVMVIGKTYDFRKQQAKKQNSLAQVPSAGTVLGDQITTQAPVVTFATPAQGTALTTTLPLIQGTGVPGKIVTITIGINNPTSGTTTVATDGTFRYTPVSPLAPGHESATITTIDANNKPVALTHSFEILKSGTQVLGDATPSATLTPTATPIVTETPALTPALSPTPVSTLAGQPVPTTATTTPTMILLLSGFLLLVGGGVAFVFL